MEQTKWEEERQKYWQKMAPYREMLCSPLGQEFLKYLKQETLNPPSGIYVRGSFDQTAFNLGRMSVVADLDNLARGPLDERR
jgi:hypothetical protein